MIATILLVWCLGATCETIRPPVQLDMTACAIFGQHYASDWQRENPAYGNHTLKAWRCELGERS